MLMGVRGVDHDERRSFRTLYRNLRRHQTNDPRRIGFVMLVAEVAASPWLSRENAYAYRIDAEDDLVLVVLKTTKKQQLELQTTTTTTLRGGELRMVLLEARAWGSRFELRAK